MLSETPLTLKGRIIWNQDIEGLIARQAQELLSGEEEDTHSRQIATDEQSQGGKTSVIHSSYINEGIHQ